MREALGKGADAVLAAAAQCMEYGTRTCTYAELSAAWAAAENRQGEAWTAARTLGDEALLALSVWCSPGGAPPLASRCHFGLTLATDGAELVAFLPGSEASALPGNPATARDPNATLTCWLQAVAEGHQGRFPWGPPVRWYLDSCPPRIHERRATVTTARGRSGVTRRPRLASQAATGRWAELVQVGTINGELVAAQTRMPLDPLSVWRPSAAAKSRCIRRLPLAARDERLAMVAAYDPRNVVLRGDTSLLMDIAHMADWPVRATVREWAALLARSRDGGFRRPLPSDCRRVWDAAAAARSMHLRERDAQGRLSGRLAPLVHVDAVWQPGRPADPDRDEIIIGPARWLREAMLSAGGWTLTAAGGARAMRRLTTGEQSMAGLIVTALEYFLSGLYDGKPGLARLLTAERPGGPGPVAELSWQDVMYLVGEPAEFASRRERHSAYMRFYRAIACLVARGYAVPPAAPLSSAPAGDSVEILDCVGRPRRLRFRGADWYCAVAHQVATRKNGFAQVPLGDYVQRDRWQVSGAEACHA